MVESYNNISEANILNEGLAQLGLESDKGKLLFFVKDKDAYAHAPSIWFQLELAELYHADAVFFKKGIRENEYIPQIYIYDQTNIPLANTADLTEIHKKVWTGGEVPLVCVFSKTEIKILDTTKPIELQPGIRPLYCIEAKRLPTGIGEREKEYVYGFFSSGSPSGGIQRFKTGDHGFGLPKSALLGYVETNDFSYWHNVINQWIADKAKELPEEWKVNEQLHEFEVDSTHAYSFSRSIAYRSANSIELFHLWVKIPTER